LLENKAKLPKHIFFSGREAANIKRSRIDVDSYDDDLFLRKRKRKSSVILQ